MIMTRKRRNRRILIPVVLLCGVLAIGGWQFWPRAVGDNAEAATDRTEIPSGLLTHIAADPDMDVELASGAMRGAAPAMEIPEPVVDEVLEPITARPPTGGESAGSAARSESETTGQSVAAVSPDDVEPAVVQADLGSDVEDRPRTTGAANLRPVSAGDAPPMVEAPPSDDRIAQVMRRYESGAKLEARRELNAMLARSTNPTEQVELRRRLERIAEETVFTPEIIPGDPLFDLYEIRAGDNLISIGRRYEVPHEAIMLINGIADARRIRAQQKIKVPNGPFHAEISISQFRLDLYLQDTYVRSFRVGLGASQSTPAGVWLVKDRLENPTYFPPASATDKRIIPPNDPGNPLGVRWIGLEGIEGAAVGQESYGIHGTNEPHTIGQAVSMGCVRMLNEDVTWVYKFLLPRHSRVRTLP